MLTRISLVTLTICLLLSAGHVQAQNKIGYISLNELMVAMPEYKKAIADMDEYQKALQGQNLEYQQNFSRLDSVFNVDSAKWTSAQKDIKRRQLNEAYLKMANYPREADQLIQRKEQELVAPIQQKAVTTTQAVAKENGYSYVLSKDQLIAFPTADDVLPLVAKKLGLTLTPPASTTAPAGTTPAKKP